MNLLNDIMKLIVTDVDRSLVLVVLLFIALIYIWFQHNRYRILKLQLAIQNGQRKESVANDRNQSAFFSPERKSNIFTDFLIIDDESSIRSMLQVMIQTIRKGALFNFAIDGEEAMVKINSLQPSFIIMDIALPKKSGIDIILEMQKRQLNIPTLIISNYAELEQLKNSRIHTNEYLVFLKKPFTFKEIADQIDKLETSFINDKNKSQLHDTPVHPAPKPSLHAAEPRGEFI